MADDKYRDSPELRAKLVEENQRKHNQICQRVDTLSRSATVQRLLARDGGQLLQKLGKRFQVEVIGFARDVWQAPSDRIEAVFSWPDAGREGKAPGVPAEERTSPERDSTDLNRPLNHALEVATQGRGAVRGVILLTDGKQPNESALPFSQAFQLSKLAAPIYPVGLGTRESRTALAVVSIDAPSVILKDPQKAQTINALVKANIRLRGVPANVITVELKRDDPKEGPQVLGRQTIPHNGVDRDQSVFFPISLDKEGPQKLTVEIQAPPGWTDLTALKRKHEIAVIKEQAEVLMIEGEARWEYHYISVALSRDKLVKEVKSVVFDQPRLGKNGGVPEEDLAKQNWPARQLPTDPHALADYDTVILGDVDPEKLPLEQRQRLARYVRECGGTLVIVAGKRFMPMAYLKQPRDPSGRDPLLDLLPVTDLKELGGKDDLLLTGFPVTLTAEGEDTSLLQMEDRTPGAAGPQEGGAGDRKKVSVWDQLPPHYWAVVGTKKPGATTLAYYPGETEQERKVKKENRRARGGFPDRHSDLRQGSSAVRRPGQHLALALQGRRQASSSLLGAIDPLGRRRQVAAGRHLRRALRDPLYQLQAGRRDRCPRPPGQGTTRPASGAG